MGDTLRPRSFVFQKGSWTAATAPFGSYPAACNRPRPSVRRRPQKEYATYSPVPFFTQVEVALGLGGTCRLGFNIGELVDFLLGWGGKDIFNDDLEVPPAVSRRERRKRAAAIGLRPGISPGPGTE